MAITNNATVQMAMIVKRWRRFLFLRDDFTVSTRETFTKLISKHWPAYTRIFTGDILAMVGPMVAMITVPTEITDTDVSRV